MDAKLVELGNQFVAGLGGGVAAETLLENYLMGHVPQWAKPLIVPTVTIGGAALVSIVAGVPVTSSLISGVVAWGTAVLAHNAAPSNPDHLDAPKLDVPKA